MAGKCHVKAAVFIRYPIFNRRYDRNFEMSCDNRTHIICSERNWTVHSLYGRVDCACKSGFVSGGQVTINPETTAI